MLMHGLRRSISQWVELGKLFLPKKPQRRSSMPGPKGVGLTKWFDQKWVNIGAPKKKGKYQPCGTSGVGGSGYAKCVPVAKAKSMTPAQKKSAVTRKRQTGTPEKGVKAQSPKNVSTFAKGSKKK
jgi:hypothetical protein